MKRDDNYICAPTYNSPQEQKDRLYDHLQQAVDSVPEDHLLMLGDIMQGWDLVVQN